ncbi:HET-domain-containing protein [Pilatotrama ljubarskyi]|nr:HET-domain-containing protein [Pilatotrama ljubarskyi]
MMDSTGSIRSLLCEGCWAGPFAFDAFRRMVEKRAYIEYRTTWPHVQQGADHGCGFCMILITDKDETQVDVTFLLSFRAIPAYAVPPSLSGSAITSLSPPGLQCLNYEIARSDLDSEFYNNIWFLRTAPDDPAASEIVARDPILEVNSPHCYSLVLEQIVDCIKNHKECPESTTDSPLPTRVIDCLDPSHPRLFVSGGTTGHYVALSYVWGEEQPNRTTLSNIVKYINGIDMALIPRTIRNAIEVTHKMGLRYLWVDSFCIIQDSREDKTRELQNLRHIFRHAHITIIAASAPSASSGFLQKREPAFQGVETPRLPYWCADGRIGIVTAEPDVISTDRLRDPVNARAWCLEERLLSPRKLVYASDTVQYHCQTTISYVGGAIARPRTAERLHNVTFLSDSDIAAYVSRWTAGIWGGFQSEWADFLSNYTLRAVTKPRDKLTALAAVAEQVHRVWHQPGDPLRPPSGSPMANRYIAGLWERTLAQDLLWRRNTYDVPLVLRPSKHYLAPSWSWASVDGPVFLLDAGYDSRLRPEKYAGTGKLRSANVVSCEATLEDERLPYGRVKDGLLRLQAALIPTSWDAGLTEPRLYMARHGPQSSLRMMDASHEEREEGAFECIGDVYMDSTDEVNGQVWAVPTLWNIGPSWEEVHAAGLLVTKAKDGVRFTRVGFWSSPEIMDDSEESLAHAEARVSWLRTLSEDVDGIPVVEVI